MLKAPFWDDSHNLSITGAAITGGRWNPPGKGILYTSTTPELALLEVIVHLKVVPFDELPPMRMLVLEVDDDDIDYVNPIDLPADWRLGHSEVDRHQFTEPWIDNPTSLGLAVPSSIMDISYNLLLAPNHIRYMAIPVISKFDYNLDPRLWKYPTS